MKRAPLISVALTVAFAVACGNPAKTTQAGLITICVAVFQDAQNQPVVQVTSPSFGSAQAQKIRWCVYNNTNSPLDELSIVFPTGSSVCVNIPPALTNIPAGNDPAECTTVCECAGIAQEFAYKIVVKTGGKTAEANPRVILN